MSKIPQLIFEELQDTTNNAFLTLIEYKKVKYLVIIDNIVGNEIYAYVLDHLKSEDIDQDWFMKIATYWFYSASEKYPLSFEFSKCGKTQETKKILKTFNISSVSRIIGKLFKYELNTKPKVKRRKVVPVSDSIEIKLKNTNSLQAS